LVGCTNHYFVQVWKEFYRCFPKPGVGSKCSPFVALPDNSMTYPACHPRTTIRHERRSKPRVLLRNRHYCPPTDRIRKTLNCDRAALTPWKSQPKEIKILMPYLNFYSFFLGQFLIFVRRQVRPSHPYNAPPTLLS